MTESLTDFGTFFLVHPRKKSKLMVLSSKTNELSFEGSTGNGAPLVPDTSCRSYGDSRSTSIVLYPFL